MKKTILLIVTLILGAASAQMSLPQESDAYFELGADTLERMLTYEPNTNQAKNVILFVSDGAGPAIVTATRIFQGQQMGMMGEEHVLSFEVFPNTAVTKTYNTNAQTPDSAGTSTAMNTGVKTKQGVLGVSADVLRGVCGSNSTELMSLFEMAEMAGMATGVVSTARITHATPGATYAHTPDRNWEDQSGMPEEAIAAGCTDVASQLVDFPFGDGLELALGGGRRHFLPAEQADPEDEGETGRRTDGRDLTADWMDAGGSFVYDQAGFDALDPTDGAPVLGLFERSHLEYEADRRDDTGGEPSLAEMTAFAIEKLMAEAGDGGFVLNVESGRVDHAAHAGNAYRMLTDNVEFAEAVQTALDMVDLDETLIIVTADHAHTVTLAGYAQRGNDILGLVRGLDGQGEPTGEPVLAADGKPYTSIGFANGPGAADIIGQPERPDLTEEMVLDPDFRQQALVPMSSETHGGTDIITYAHGPHAFLVRGVVEQNYIFHVMEKALDLRSRAAQASLLRPGFEQRALEILDAALPEVSVANAETE